MSYDLSRDVDCHLIIRFNSVSLLKAMPNFLSGVDVNRGGQRPCDCSSSVDSGLLITRRRRVVPGAVMGCEYTRKGLPEKANLLNNKTQLRALFALN